MSEEVRERRRGAMLDANASTTTVPEATETQTEEHVDTKEHSTAHCKCSRFLATASRNSRTNADCNLPSDLHLLHWACVFSVLGVVMCFVHFFSLHYLPLPESPPEENDKFSEVRAFPMLVALSAMGPKPSGSLACERDVFRAILGELEQIQENAGDQHRLTIETQFPSGCFNFQRSGTDGFPICYRNISNIIVRLGDKAIPAERSVAVLVNCHYDSHPSSYGASDDLISCALALEMLRVMSDMWQLPPSHDVIFLFNGAEESYLLGAHGFITTHPWRHSLRAFVNLEASGSSGRELLFQAGPGNQWLLNSYLEAAPHPHCSVIGQEVFQSGAFPGFTDFRIFRDYGRIPGLDLAFVQNGYVYHTEFDRAELITPGSLQRAGENVLKTVRYLLNSPYLKSPAEYGEMKFVFFDIVGLVTVVYSMQVATYLNLIVAAGVFLKVASNFVFYEKQSRAYSLKMLLWSTATHLLSFASVALMQLGLVKIVALFNMHMFWYSNQWLCAALYGTFAFAIILFVHLLRAEFFILRKSAGRCAERATFDSHLLLMAAVLAVLTFMGIASAFVFLILVAMPLCRDISFCTTKQVRDADMRSHPAVFIAAHLWFSLPIFVMVAYLGSLSLSIFIPIMGRSSSCWSEVIIALFSSLPAVLIASGVSSWVYRSSPVSLSRLLKLVALFLAVLLVLLMTTSLGAPYSYSDESPRTRRVQLYHSRRQIFGTDGNLMHADSGIVAIAQDCRGVDDIPFVDSSFSSISCVTDNKYCDLPFVSPVTIEVSDRLVKFKAVDEELHFKEPVTLNLLEKKSVRNEIEYSLRVTGSDQISVFITPQKPYRLANWSLTPIDELNNDGTSFVFLHCNGERCGQWDFLITIQNTDNEKVENADHELLVAAAAHYLHGEQMISASLRELLDQIKQKRSDGDDPDRWRWAITASAWTSDLVSRYF